MLVPVNSRYTGHEVADVVDRTGARLVVVDGRLPRPHPGRRPARGQRAVLGAASSTCVDLHRPRLRRGDHRPTIDAIAERGLPRRRRRHPLHLRHHRPQPRARCRAHRQTIGVARRLGRARRRHRPTTATWWSTRSSTPSATRSASSPGCSPARRSTRSRPSTSTQTMALIETERITVLPGRADDLHLAAQRARPRRPRPLLAAARGHRRRRRTRRADRADAGRAWPSTRSSRPSA